MGVVVAFPKEELIVADAAMTVIAEEEIEPTTKITEIAINNKWYPIEIIFIHPFLMELYKAVLLMEIFQINT